ncbi:hypothetical protein N2152v2_005603 [Parachlorella kessleri]
MRGLLGRDSVCARGNLLWDRRLSAPPATGSLLFDRRPLVGSDPASGPAVSNRRQLQVWAARKSDGKQQRKPKSAVKAEEPPPTQAPAPAKPPPRIGTTPLPGRLKQQLTFVKAVREYTKKAAQPAPVTRSWRKPKQSVEEIKEQRRLKEEELKLTKKEANTFALRQIHDSTNDYRRKAVLLVDGYNVIGDRKDKNEEEGAEGGLLLPGQILEEERDKLIELLATYSQQAGIRIIVAFDAMRSGRQDNSEELLSNGVTVVYCGACEADTYITTAVKRMLEKGYNLVAVATNDEMVRVVSSAPTLHHTKYGKQVVHHVSVRALKRDMHEARRQVLKALADYTDDNYIATAKRGSQLSDLATLRQRLLRAAPPTAQAAGAGRQGNGHPKVPGRVAGETRAQRSSSDTSAP